MRSEKQRQWGSVVENWGLSGILYLMGVLDGLGSAKFRCVAVGPRRLAECRVG